MPNNLMKRTSLLPMRLLSGFGLALSLAGCVGYVQGDGDGVVVGEPELTIFGGYGDGGPARGYGRRGAISRGHAGPAPAARSGGGGRGGGKR
jgi:hypothetical protein